MSVNSNKLSYNTSSGNTDLVITEPVHNIKGIAKPVSHINVGSRLACYGRTITQINGRIVESYHHFSYGDYILDPPLVFKSFHVNIKSV